MSWERSYHELGRELDGADRVLAGLEREIDKLEEELAEVKRDRDTLARENARLRARLEELEDASSLAGAP